MKAIILAAGKGERLQPFTKEIPKSLLKVGSSTPLDSLIKKLRLRGVKEIKVFLALLIKYI